MTDDLPLELLDHQCPYAPSIKFSSHERQEMITSGCAHASLASLNVLSFPSPGSPERIDIGQKDWDLWKRVRTDFSSDVGLRLLKLSASSVQMYI